MTTGRDETKPLILKSGTIEFPDHTIVDYTVVMDSQQFSDIVSELEQKAENSEQKLSAEASCTVTVQVRRERGHPSIAELLDIWEVGCGDSWHYESHSYHSACPVCISGAPDSKKTMTIDQAKLTEASDKYYREHRNRFPGST